MVVIYYYKLTCDVLPQIFFKAKLMEVLSIKVEYGILCKGIHELRDREYLEIFPHVQLGIELISDEKLNQNEKESKINDAKKKLSEITGNLN